MPDPATPPTTGSGGATGANPWFVGADPPTEGLSTTAQQGVTNQQVNGLAQDLSNQSTSLITALNGILTAINNQPSHA